MTASPKQYPELNLVPVTPLNYESALSLSVRPDQEDLVAPVQKSLADAYVYPQAIFRLACLGETPIGYLLLFPFDSDQGRTVNVVRLMIDQQFQNRGHGRKLLESTLEWIRTFEPVVQRVRISTLPHNRTAHALYESMGFIRSGTEEGEDVFYIEVGGQTD